VGEGGLLVIADDDEGQDVAEGEPREFVPAFADDRLAAYRPVLVHVEVEHRDFAVVGDAGEDSGAVRRPLDVADRHSKVEHE
jgi:hypothetical protein